MVMPRDTGAECVIAAAKIRQHFATEPVLTGIGLAMHAQQLEYLLEEFDGAVRRDEMRRAVKVLEELWPAPTK